MISAALGAMMFFGGGCGGRASAGTKAARLQLTGFRPRSGFMESESKTIQ
jgi:hypothetical protein